jgi:hypothetical protein
MLGAVEWPHPNPRLKLPSELETCETSDDFTGGAGATAAAAAIAAQVHMASVASSGTSNFSMLRR